jgi:hypothetical protein
MRHDQPSSIHGGTHHGARQGAASAAAPRRSRAAARVDERRTPDRHGTRMRCRHLMPFVLSFALGACRGDNTITHGADGAREWDRKLQAAVPFGTPVQDVRLLMERNGFRCKDVSAPETTLYCDKRSGGRFDVVERRWQAIFDVQDGHVIKIHGSTGLTGP